MNVDMFAQILKIFWSQIILNRQIRFKYMQIIPKLERKETDTTVDSATCSETLRFKCVGSKVDAMIIRW